MSRTAPIETSRAPWCSAAIRVDASAAIGSGHLTRCTALALALKRIGVECTFVCSQLPDDSERLLTTRGFSVVRLPRDLHEHATTDEFRIDRAKDSEAVSKALAGMRFDALIVDRYGIDYLWHRALRHLASSIVAVDDLADRRFDVDVVINQNPAEGGGRYAGLLPEGCRQLLGPRFALLRPEFAQRRDSGLRRSAGSPRHVVLFAGGGDPGNATGWVLDAWERLEDLDKLLDVVIGSEHPHGAALRRRCATMRGVTLHVQTDEMASLLARADLLIGAAGSVSWERCCLGVPALMFSIADNQAANLRFLADHRTGVSVGRAGGLDAAALSARIRAVLERPGLLRRMGRRASALVDGLGALRAALALAGVRVELRSATFEDAKRVWPWRNDPSTRRFFHDDRALTLEEHESWWARTLRDESRRLLIAHCGAHAVGVLRLDVRGTVALVSIYVDPAFTGLGLGRATLRAGQELARGAGGLSRLEAEILPQNSASASAFSAVGFEREGSRWIWEARR
jgi:UDP-2,4-diacetamido-2,4,6-trideoxy-beta-L-altropyranose hydrolase